MTSQNGSAPAVAVDHGRVEFSGRPVLRDVDLRVEVGEVVALLGENGSGKSTLARAILGLTPLTGGSVRLFGQPLEEFDQWQRIGYVPQRSTATGGVPATVAEVVGSGRLARRRPLWPRTAADRTAVREALAAVGLADRARDPMSTLSGGQQQRALIARALAGEPDLYVLDEPNAGVDAGHQQGLADTLEVLVARGATVLVVLHELGPLRPLIDRTVTVCDGRAVPDHVHSLPDHPHHHVVDPTAATAGLGTPLVAPLEGGA